MEDNTKANKVSKVLFVIYLIALLWIILFKFNVQFSYPGDRRSVNLVPFSEPLILNDKISYGEIILNGMIFLPLGIFAGILFRKWIIGKMIFMFFSISLICEAFQFILGIGTFDTTDIITNTLGGIIGLLTYKGIEKAFKNSVKAQKFINVLATTGTILMILFLLFLRINKLWIFRM